MKSGSFCGLDLPDFGVGFLNLHHHGTCGGHLTSPLAATANDGAIRRGCACPSHCRHYLHGVDCLSTCRKSRRSLPNYARILATLPFGSRCGCSPGDSWLVGYPPQPAQPVGLAQNQKTRPKQGLFCSYRLTPGLFLLAATTELVAHFVEVLTRGLNLLRLLLTLLARMGLRRIVLRLRLGNLARFAISNLRGAIVLIECVRRHQHIAHALEDIAHSAWVSRPKQYIE